MEYLYLLLFILFVGFILSLVIGIIKLLWPVLLVLAIYIGFKYYNAYKQLNNEINNQVPYQSGNNDYIDVDFEVKKEEE